MALLVPEGMAYAELAGVPPRAAFYAAPIGLLLYAAFGRSRQLTVAVSSGEVLTATQQGVASEGYDDSHDSCLPTGRLPSVKERSNCHEHHGDHEHDPDVGSNELEILVVADLRQCKTAHQHRRRGSDEVH
jgi:hypothetical protein